MRYLHDKRRRGAARRDKMSYDYPGVSSSAFV